MVERVLLIAYPFAGTGANMLRYQSFARYLSENGIMADIIGYYQLKSDLPKGTRYYQIKKRLTLPFVWYFIRLFVENLFLLQVQSVSQYLNRVALASLTYVMAMELMKNNNYDACFVGIHPWAFYLIIPLLKKHIQTVLDIGDPLYKNAITKKSNYKSNFLFEKRALESADYVVTMNEPTITIMTEEMGIAKSKIQFISPAMNIESYRPNEKKSFSLNKPLRMIYSGSLYQGYRDLNEVQPAIESLNYVFLDVFTNISPKNKSSERVKFHDWIPHNDLLRLYQEYDLLLFVDNNFGYQVPSKIFEIIAQNKPILFVYDKRNVYFYNLLCGQEGIFFVENNREKIANLLTKISRKQSLDVCYTFDLTPFSEETVNRKLLTSLIIK